MQAIGPSSATPESFPPGTRRKEWQVGDIVLTHNAESFVSKLIRFGQRLRYRGEDTKFAWYNHAAVVVSPDGDLIEALGHGIVKTHVTRYDKEFYSYIDVGLNDSERTKVGQYAQRVSDLNSRYGYLQIIAIAISLLTGSHLQFSLRGQNICSGFAAESLRAGGYWFERKGQIASSSFITPADLAHAFGSET